MAMLIAHRGFRSATKENRMIDFENALKICKAVEFDIRLTKDNQVVIFHDDTFKRIANENLKVSELTYQEISNLKFFQQNREWTPVLLSDFTRKVSKSYEMINVEIKTELNSDYSSEKLKIIFSEINQLTNHTKAEIIVSSFNQKVLNRINETIKLPIKKGYLFDNIKFFNEALAKKFDYLHPEFTLAINSEMSSKLKKLKKPLNIWTFKTDDEAKKIHDIYQKQVHGYISDNPNLKIL